MATPKEIRRRGRWSLILGTIFAFAAFAAVAYADNVQDDVVVGGNDTMTAGGSTTVNYRISATGQGTDGQNGCNAADGSSATVTINAPAGVTANPSSLSFTSCGLDKDVTFTSSTVGNYSITVSVSDSGVGTYSTTHAAFTLKVIAPADATAPVITPTVTGTVGNNDWYTSNVNLSWSVVDNESAISSQSGCGAVSITADQAATTYTCTATSGGGTKSESITIKRDATAPTATATASAANINGWNNTDVTVSFSGGDVGGSGLDFCSADVVLSSEGANQSASGTCTDKAGNVSETASQSGINIDKTAPTNITFVGGPAAGESYYFGSVPAGPTCTADGAISGLTAAGCTVSGYSAAVGSHEMTASATDRAGNVGTAKRSYTVRAWTLSGFFQPVDMGGIYNSVKSGSTVPLKFRIFAGATELTEISAVKSLSYVKVTCAGAAIEDAIEELAPTGGTLLRYDSTGGQFIYNLKTSGKALECYRATMTAQDGSTIVAYFKLK